MPWVPIEQLAKAEIKNINNSFRKKARFLIDENLDMWVAQYLRDKGWNAKRISEFSLRGITDENIFSFSQKEKRIILTHDTDFLDHRRFPFYKNPGVFIFPGGSGNVDIFAVSLIDMIQMCAPYGELYQGSKIIFFENREFKIIYLNHEGKIQNTRYKLSKDEIFEWK